MSFESNISTPMKCFEKFTGGVARYPPYFGRGRGTIFLDELECNGTETKLVDCDRHGKWGKHNCYHREDAGVHCFNENTEQKGRPMIMLFQAKDLELLVKPLYRKLESFSLSCPSFSRDLALFLCHIRTQSSWTFFQSNSSMFLLSRKHGISTL